MDIPFFSYLSPFALITSQRWISIGRFWGVRCLTKGFIKKGAGTWPILLYQGYFLLYTIYADQKKNLFSSVDLNGHVEGTVI